MSEDQKPAAPTETTETSENAAEAEQPTATATATTVTPPSSKLIPTAKRTLILMFLVLIIGIGIILWAWKIGPFDSTVESTDNSYVKGKTTVLSSQINGYVKDVLVSDFDHVKKGQV
ncbi:MAG: HlyD family secretion protein, partial [Acinetobacter sp.]|nr:HlyD family secretion protein [Acinetobacter sp.]